MVCASCGRGNQAGARFCGGCGKPLAPRCPACGIASEPGAQFCQACGAPLVAPTQAAGERKVVTIVFADLAGSTALHERLDAESTRAFMDRYYAAMQGAVEAHGGTVTQLLGDGVKAVFGAPRVAEDDALRAVRAAMDMQRAFRELASEQSAAVGKVGLRVAVHTGEVVAKDESEIIGDPVNVAARLQQEAQDGDVLIGASTQRLVGGLVTLVPFGTFTLKGRAEPVAAWRVVSLERPSGAPAVAFVGREDELRRLLAVHDTAVASPGARLAVVLGSPGLGKSRLLAELGHRLGDRTTILLARCDAAGSATFAPIAEALREHLGIEAGADHDALRAAIGSALPGDAAEQARIVDGIADLLAGTPASPEETFFVVRRLLAALAAAQPVVLAIDDLQWAEPLLLDLTEHLVQWGAGVPLLVLAAARPELRDVRSSLTTHGGLVADVVTLAGLDAVAATRLAANVVGTDALPAALAGRVLATSEGNPLFVSELVRMLVDDGVLKREGERWTAGVDLSTLEMPPTIHALLAARIERLRPEERSVLERAAVVGRQFSRTAVAQLLPPEVSDLDARLESLRRSELVEPDTGWLLGEPVLRFHHGLIRDAAYRRLLKGTRAELHERFADWLEGRVGEAVEHDETLGWHLEQAHQHLRELGPLDAQGRALGERASRRLAAAGRRALARDDLPLAAGLLGRALERLDAADPARAELALDACEALLSAGEVGPAAAAIDELGRLAVGSERLQAWHTCFAGELAALTDPKALRATAEVVAAAAEGLASLGDATGEAKAHFVHAQALSRLGQVGACEAALDRALAAARRAGDRRRSNAVLAGAPLAALWGPGPVARASGRCLDVVRVLRITQGAPGVEAVALRCQAVLEALRGRSDAARRMIASSRRMVEELGITQGLLETEYFAGLVELIEGDDVAAERSLRAAYEGLRGQGLGIDAARAAALLGRTLLAQGRDAEAEALSHESEALAGDDLQAAITWRRVRAEALAQRGEHAAALGFARAAVEIATTTDVLLLHADARLALAAALRAAGRSDEASAEEARATLLWEAKGATLLAERLRQGIGGAQGVQITPAQREEPVPTTRRRVRANAGTTALIRLDAAIATRDVDALPALFADEFEIVDRTTGVVFDRNGVLATWRSLLRAEAPTCRHEPLATLGDSLVLCRQSVSARGLAGRELDVGAHEGEAFFERVEFDVGAFEVEKLNLIEVDAGGSPRRVEVFAADRLGDAVARLYERYAELLPEGPARTRAAATARTTAIYQGPIDLERYAAAWVSNVAFVDRRTIGLGPAQGRDAYLELLGTLVEAAPNATNRVDDVLSLRPDAWLLRITNFGTDRTTGGAYERPYLMISVLGTEGLVTRNEQFDAEREADALARFDELAAEAPALRPVRRRVGPNAATAYAARVDSAFAARGVDALLGLLSDDYQMLDHPSGVAYDREAASSSHRALLRARDPTYQQEPLATLGDSLALCRVSISGRGYARADLDVGAYEIEKIEVVEVDAHGRGRRGEAFAPDRLGDAVVRLYERYAELLPEGPEKMRAAATARSVGTVLREPPERAALAQEAEARDHRTVGFGFLRGPDAIVQAIRGLRQLSDDVEERIDDVLGLRPDALLAHWTTSGTIRASGGAFEQDLRQLFVFGGDGLLARWEQFDGAQEVAALARFDELTAGPAHPVRRRVGTNAATVHVAQLEAAVAARDADALGKLLAEDYEAIDHTTGASYGRSGQLDYYRRQDRVQDLARRTEPLATLGDSLALCHHSVSGSGAVGNTFDVGAFEFDNHMLTEVDAQGRRRRLEIFAADRLGDAVVRLYERYAELLPDGPERARATATARSVATVLGPPDLDRLGEALAPAVEFVDHRTLGFGSARGADALLKGRRILLETCNDVANRVDDVLALRADALLGRLTTSGTDRAGGGVYEKHLLVLWVFGSEGLVVRVEQFDAGREAEAIARFDELLPKPPAVRPTRRRVRANAGTASAARFDAAIAARDTDALPRLLTENAEVIDHTTGVSYGRAEALAFYRRQLRVQDLAVRQEPLATLGDSLALCRYTVSGSSASGRTFDIGAFEFDNHRLVEADADGRYRRLEIFATDHLGDAVARLYERYAELLPDGPERTHAAANARLAATFAGPFDPDRFAIALAAAIEVVDHRTLGTWSMRGTEAFVRNLRSWDGVADEITRRADDILALRADALLARWTHLGTDRASGGAYERPFLLLWTVGADGLATRWEFFDPDREAEALARFDELSADVSGSPLDNVASRSLWRLERHWHARDWEGVVSAFHPCYRVSDRRALIGMELEGEEALASLRMSFDVESGRWSSELLATRGARLALFRRKFEGEVGAVGPFESERLSLVETDGDSRRVLQILFDPDDLDAAWAELDARYAAGELADDPVAATSSNLVGRAFATRDWEALAAQLAPDLVVTDHRVLGWETLHGPAAYVATLRSLVDLAPDARLRTDHVRTSRRGRLVVATWLGTREGGAFEAPRVVVSDLDAAGRIRRFDFYDLEQLDAAWARFESIPAEGARDPLAALARPNAATAAIDRVQAAFEARDWAALRAVYTEEARFEDRRRQALVSGTVDLFFHDTKRMATPDLRIERQLVATAGDRVALARYLWRGGPNRGEFEIEYLGLTEVDESGRIVSGVCFDLDDWRAAHREAATRWFAGDAMAAAVVGPGLELVEAMNERDLARIRSLLADDVAVDQRYQAGLGLIEGADAYVASLPPLWDLAPDIQFDAPFRLALGRHGLVSVMRSFGTLREGGAFERPRVGVMTVAGGLITRIELFDVEAADAALARFEELRPDPLRIPPNAATQAARRWQEVITTEDWEGAEALLAPTVVLEDRRRGFLMSGDRELLLASVRLIGPTRPRISLTVVATAGERLVLQRVFVEGAYEEDSAFEVEFLEILEVDGDGRLVAVLEFDPDDRRAASRELLDRWGRSEAAYGLPVGSRRAVLDRDLVRLRAELPDGIVFHDHRRIGAGRIEGADGYVAWIAALLEGSPDAIMEHLYYVAVETHGFLAVSHTFGTLAQGGEFESVFAVVAGPGRTELFELDDLDRARARFEELGAGPHADARPG